MFWEPDGDPESMWNLAYDLARERFNHLDTVDDPPLTQMPLRLLSSPSDYFMRVSEIGDPKLIRHAKRLFDRFKDYMVAVVTLGDMAIEEVGPVFERVNSTGTRLTIVELMRAATWKPEFDLGDSIGQILAVLDEKGYGQIDRKVVLRAIAAAGGFGFSTENIEQLRALDKNALQTAVDSTEAAARLAVDFLVTQIKTPTAAALPYLNQFAVLVEIFHQVPKPSADQYAAIRRWFWRTVFGGYFRGWNNAQMVADRQAIEDFANGDTAEIEVPVALPGPDIWRRTQFRSDNALSKMLVLLMTYQDPHDLRTGLRIDVGQALVWDNTKQFHHFFPKNYLKGQGVSFERANVLANLIMLTSISNNYISDQMPSAYLQDLVDAYGEDEIRQRARSCLVDEGAYGNARLDRYDLFLEHRANTLHRRALELVGGVSSTDSRVTVTPLDEWEHSLFRPDFEEELIDEESEE